MENQFNHPESEKHVSSVVGIVIIVLVAIIAILVFWNYRQDTIDVMTEAPSVIVPMQVEKNVETEKTASDEQTAVDNGPVDFDQEMKDLDADISSVDSTDFGDSNLSDANLGL